MWLATPVGFFSAVQAKDADGNAMISVRTRSAKDAQALAQWLHDNCGYARDDEQYPTVKSLVITDVGRRSDYPARVYVWREDWVKFVSWSAEQITYGNFKSEVMRVQGWAREHIYHDVWAAFKKIENEGKVKRPSYLDWRPRKPQGTLMDLLGGPGSLDLGDVEASYAGIPASESDKRCSGCDKFLDQCPNKGECESLEELLADFDAAERNDQRGASA